MYYSPDHIRDHFRNCILSYEGQNFEDFFVEIIRENHPHFRGVKAYGIIGDGKNDGYDQTTHTFYQCFAPEDITKTQTIYDACKKLENDFLGLMKQWDLEYTIEHYFFVINDKRKGVPKPIHDKIHELNSKDEYKHIHMEIFDASSLEDEFDALSYDVKCRILGLTLPDIQNKENNQTETKNQKKVISKKTLLFALLFCAIFFSSILWIYSNRSQPTDVENSLLQAEELFQQQKYDDTLKIYQKIKDDSPVAQNNLVYLYEKGYVSDRISGESIFAGYKSAALAGYEKALGNFLVKAISEKNAENIVEAFQIAYKEQYTSILLFEYCAGNDLTYSKEILGTIKSGACDSWFENFSIEDADSLLQRIEQWHSGEVEYDTSSSVAFTGEEEKRVFMGAIAGYQNNSYGIYYKYSTYLRGLTYLQSLYPVTIQTGFIFTTELSSEESQADALELLQNTIEESEVQEASERILIEGSDDISLSYNDGDNRSLYVKGWVCPGHSTIYSDSLSLSRDGMTTDDDLVRFRFHVKNISGSLMENLTIRCDLPQSISYIPDSTKLFNSNHPDGVSVGNNLFCDEGMNIGDYSADAGAWIYFDARINESVLNSDSLILRTIFEANGGAGTEKTYTDIISDYTEYYMKLTASQKQSDLWEESISATEGEEISVRIVFDNQSEKKVENVRVKATLPYGFEYIEGSTTLTSSGTGGRHFPLEDGITEESGISIGSIDSGANGYVIFNIRKTKAYDKCSELLAEMTIGGEKVNDFLLIYNTPLE